MSAPSSRLRSDFWVAAYLRRCGAENVAAVLRRRGAAEAGAIFVKVDCLDGTAVLIGPASQSEVQSDGERRFVRMHEDDRIPSSDAETRLLREIRFDPDLWIVEIDDGAGRCFLDLSA